MPPPLDLVHSTHSKIMVAPPRINLRRAASYNAQDRGPLSATTSRFNFNHLLFSPPPSPSLPSPLPRPKKAKTRILKSRPSRILRYMAYTATCFLLVYLLTASAFPIRRVRLVHWPYFSNYEYEMVGQDELPDFPTPIIVSDSAGQSKWTVSIPPDHLFPLTPQEYHDVSSQCQEVSARARELHNKPALDPQTMITYDVDDDFFVDVDKAEKTGLLPNSARGLKERHTSSAGHFVGLTSQNMAGKPVCSKSMTFVLEGNDAGLGNTLMMLWTFYGLAREQGRAFFIDDSRWVYGQYADLFEPPAAPHCRPAPRHQMLPCPAQAKHLVVSSVTAKDLFPTLMAKHLHLSGARDSVRELFDLARTGYDALFNLTSEDRTYVTERVRQLQTQAKPAGQAAATTSDYNPIIGLHIRHGDQHPLEYEYQGTYIPSEVFLEAAERAAAGLPLTSASTPSSLPSSIQSSSSSLSAAPPSFLAVIASDDPTVLEQPEFSTSAVPAQDRIRLVSKQGADESEEPKDPSVLHSFQDPSVGWEGGFFARMFWNLGTGRKNNAGAGPTGQILLDAGQVAQTPSEETLRLRSMVGRAYMMDLLVLAEASDAVVCTVSSMGCRILGLMMGWSHGVGGKGWVNVDGDYSWTSIKW